MPLSELELVIPAVPSGTPVAVLTRAEYDALAEPDPDTLYVVVG